MYLLISTENNARFSIVLGDKSSATVKTVEKAYKQSELLLKEVKSMVKGRVKGVFVVSGPGQFSSLRIGISTANALAYGWNVPVFGVKLNKAWLELPEDEKVMKVWQKGLKSVEKGKFEMNKIVVPEYGSEPNITVKK